jgi:hypothetical protein
MSCFTCGNSSYITTPAQKAKSKLATAGANCDFTEEQMLTWKQLFLCVKQQYLYEEVNVTEERVNSALGIIISAINHKANICYFEKQLIELHPIIITIINTGKCQ